MYLNPNYKTYNTVHNKPKAMFFKVLFGTICSFTNSFHLFFWYSFCNDERYISQLQLSYARFGNLSRNLMVATMAMEFW